MSFAMKIILDKCAKLFMLTAISVSVLLPHSVTASQAVTGELSGLPTKNVIVDKETFDGFTSNKNNITSTTLKAADYQIPIKLSNNGQNSNISVKRINGASGESGDNAIQLCNQSQTTLNGTYVIFYINGKESTSAFKGERIIFEMDTMLSQTDAEVEIRNTFASNDASPLFNAGGTVGNVTSCTYEANVWKHMLIDLNFPGKHITVYYDDKIVYELELTDSQKTTSTGIVQFNLVNNTTDTAAFAFDNLNIYTVAPYSEAIGYAVGSDEYGAIDNVVVPNTADKLILSLSGAFKTASNVKSYVTLKRYGVKVDGASVAYTSNTKTDEYVITITLVQALTAGDYVIEYASGLIMEQQIGTATSTEITLGNSYHQSIKVIEPNKITLTKSADSAYNAEIYYNSEESDTVTMIIAAYENVNGMTSLSSVAYDEFDVGIGINKIILYHTDSSADYAKAMLWSDVAETTVPLTDTVFIDLK